MRTRVLSLLMRQMSRPLASWIVLAVALIVAETLVVYPLRWVAPEISLGVVYLVGVLVVQRPAALTILLAVALVLCSIAALARSRSIRADERRGEADPAAAMARLLLGTDDLRSALPGASGRLARALRLSAAAIELEAVAGEERRAAFQLRDGGTVLVPADLRQTT